MSIRFVTLVTTFGLIAAACGGGGTSGDAVASLDDTTPGSSTTTTAAVDFEQAMLDFTACLREQGIEIDDPTVDANGNLRLSRPTNFDPNDRELFQKARDACGPILERVAIGFRQEDRTQLEDTFVEYAACMRENGYDMPDPDFSNVGVPGSENGQPRGPFADIDSSDPAFIEANAACQSIFTNLPGFLGGTRGAIGPGGGGS
ncbi:MAG: hypothetical protein GWP04_02135 [Gammaproteobacteria bacterium]|nr:hypothetical protein [Gammaproteobacteria bacterium]